MASLTNLDANIEITKHVSLELSQNQISVIQQTLDGKYHIQKIGAPAVSYDMTAYVSRNGKSLLMTAESSAALMRVSVSHGVYYGRVIKLKFGDRLPGDWFKAEVTLAGEVTG